MTERAQLEAAVSRGLDRAGVDPGVSVAVACSGGPDSVALADLLRREPRLARVSLIYVDHRLRPTAAEAALVAGLARRWELEHRIVAVDIDRSRASLEDAARRARYAALETAADELGAELIATGHTASDQAETVVMRMARGTGVEGLAGIARRRGRIIRPLLDVGRDAIVRYLAERDIEAAIDPTNAELHFARNRVRHQIMPALARENPKIEAALCRLASSAVELGAVIAAAVADLAERAAVGGDLDCAVLAAAPALVAKRVLERAALDAGAGPLEAEHLEALCRMVGREPSGTVSLDLPGCRAVREYDTVRFGEGPAPGRAELSIRGPDRYQVRRWRPGDRMRPARLGGRSKKLSDLFIDAKIPRRLREQARVVVRAKDGVIEWAEHLGAAYRSLVEVTEKRADSPTSP